MIFCFKSIFAIGLIFAFHFKYASSHADEPIGKNQTEQLISELIENIDFFETKNNISVIEETGKTINSVTEKTDFITEEREDKDLLEILHEVFSDGVKPYIYEHYPFSNVSNECTSHLAKYVKALEEWEPWAVMMFDATGKLPDGFLGGTYLELGSLEDCLSIQVPQLFKGKFCTVGVEFPIVKPIQWKTVTGGKYVDAYGQPPEWLRHIMVEEQLIQLRQGFYMGTCIPSTCSELELHTIVHSMTETFNAQVSVSNCQVDEPNEWDVPTKIAISVLVLLFSVIAVGTAMDLSDRRNKKENVLKNKSLNREMMKAFSIYTNATKLFEINEDEMGVLHLVKIFFCSWVVFAHNALFPLIWREMRHNRMHNSFMLSNWQNTIMDNSFYVVDIFFLLGGFLLAAGGWQELEKNRGKLNIPFIIFKRYMRLTPAQVVLIAMMYVWALFSSGPVWKDTWAYEMDKCTKYGWKNLLHIQNLRGNDEMCHIHTWHLAVSMQQLVVVLPLLVLTYRHLKLGLILSALVIIGCIVRDFLESMNTEFLFFTYSSFRLIELAKVYVRHIYYLPFHHFSPTFFGMALGILVQKIKDPKIRKIFEIYQRRVTICAIVFIFIAYYPQYFVTPDLRITALYNSSRITLFSFAVSWFIYAAIMNGTSKKESSESSHNKGLKQTNQKSVPMFTSPKKELNIPKRSSKKSFTLAILAPFGRITFSTYLFHPLIVILRDAVLEEKLYFGYISLFAELILLNCFSFAIGILGYLIAEQPFNKAFDLWVKRDKFEESATGKEGETNEQEDTEKEKYL